MSDSSVPRDAEPAKPRRLIEVTSDSGRTHWTLDATFLTSNWTCIWGRGCQGIHDERHPELMDGCCSVGLVLKDDDEAMMIAALGASMTSEVFQFADTEGGLLEQREGGWATRIVDGACVFLNRPGFSGGAGCALHIGALAAGESPVDWKPQTCTRMPIRVDEETAADGTVSVGVRAVTRHDWGPEGASMAWWCTEGDDAFVGHEPVIDSLRDELRVLFGEDLYDEVRARLSESG
jgi:hypothetical protein